MADNSNGFSRRDFLTKSSKLAAGGLFGVFSASRALSKTVEPAMKFGLVTYLWGKDWKLPALIRNCETAGVHGVELRVDHAHGVSSAMNDRRRHETRLRFENTPVKLVGFGTNFAFHYREQAKLQENIEGAKAYIRLSRDVGGGGVKVKPNGLPDDVPEEQTIEQIGRALNELGEYAESMGQEIRVEIHGSKTSRLPVIKQIFDVVKQPSVGACWNCNDQDLEGKGLEHNFNLVKGDFGKTVHIRELNVGNYPYRQLFDLLTDMQYNGWILLEARTNPGDRIQALHRQKELFEQMINKAG